MFTRGTFLLLLCLLAACGNRTRELDLAEGEVLTIRRAFANIHLWRVNGFAILIDAGEAEESERLITILEERGVDRLDAIIITHAHADHIGGTNALQTRFGGQVVLGAADLELNATGMTGPLCPTSGRAEGWVEEDQAARYEPATPDVLIDERTSLRDALGIDVPGFIDPAPGHTPGSLLIFTGDEDDPQNVFVGDMFRGSVTGSSVETHFYMCDLDQNLQAILRLYEDFPSMDRYLPGHFCELTRDDVREYLIEEGALTPP